MKMLNNAWATSRVKAKNIGIKIKQFLNGINDDDMMTKNYKGWPQSKRPMKLPEKRYKPGPEEWRFKEPKYINRGNKRK